MVAPIVTRIASAITGQRVLWPNQETNALEHHGVDLLGQLRDSSLNRRLQTDSIDISASYAAVYAAIRWREQAITRPEIVLQRRVRGGEWDDIADTSDPSAHPLLEAIVTVNSATTFTQGFSGIERGKLTNGHHVWVKRRDRVGTPREFEVWFGHEVEVVPRKDRPWEPAQFIRREGQGENAGRETVVSPEDVIWFRHIIHPRNPMWSLTPIGAIRIQADTSMEAWRYNARHFDQGYSGGLILAPDSDDSLGEAELERLKQRIANDWRGTDNAHRIHVIESAMKPVLTPATLADLEYINMLKMSVTEVARAFELSPLALKDFDRATYENADQAEAADWTVIQNQLDATVEEFNEWLVRPDYGDDLRLIARYGDIPALAADQKVQAETDEIRMRTGYTTINALRERDGLDPVEWGDVPLVHVSFKPLKDREEDQSDQDPEGSDTPNIVVQIDDDDDDEPDRSRAVEVTPATEGSRLLGVEQAITVGMSRIFTAELRRILAFISEQEPEPSRVLDGGTIDEYDWAWASRYSAEVARWLIDAMEIALVEGGFVETPLLTAHQYAVGYAEARAAEMLVLDGPANIVDPTRRAVRDVIVRGVRDGTGNRQIRNEIRQLYGFSTSRAETIARTEVAFAQGDGARQAARAQGRDQKRWQTARDERVDGGNASGPCIRNASQGWIGIEDTFESGHDTIPSHPRCRCDVEYRTARLQERSTHTRPIIYPATVSVPDRSIVKEVTRDESGAIASVIERDLGTGRSVTRLVERDADGRIWRVTEHDDA